jgi:hypothetical protein
MGRRNNYNIKEDDRLSLHFGESMVDKEATAISEPLYHEFCYPVREKYCLRF